MTASDISELDWSLIASELDREGYCVVAGLLSDEQAASVRAACDVGRKSAGTEPSHEYGAGTSWVLPSPLPKALEGLVPELYKRLLNISRLWRLTMDTPSPGLADIQVFADPDYPRVPQLRVSSLLAGEREPIHQNDAGERGFLLEVAIMLSEPGLEFTGGEFVMTEQRPRMQSRPMVSTLKRGDAVIYAAAQRPFRGTKGFYRVNLKHAVSPVRSGSRLGATLVFSEACQGGKDV